MKYPIDSRTTETFFGHLVQNERAQRRLILALSGLLKEAMEDSTDDNAWYREAVSLFRMQQKLKTEHDTRLFNAKNGHQDPDVVRVETVAATGEVNANQETVHLPGVEITPEMNAKLNEAEKSFGEEMTEEEIAKMFNEKPKSPVVHGVDMSKKEPFKGMSLQDIEEWEARQDNSNDIWKVKARVQNAVSATGGSLTGVGEMLCNSMVHVALDLYAFADTIPDKEIRIRLIERIRKHEGMPANLIAAVAGGVKVRPGPKG